MEPLSRHAAITRRHFINLSLQTIAAASVLAFSPMAFSGETNASLQEIGAVVGTYPYKPHYSLGIFPQRCTGCKECVRACGRANDVPPYGYRLAILDRPAAGSGGKEFLPVLCNQCNRPPCTRVCPTKAIYKDTTTGIVLMEDRLCLGCGACMTACPYNALYYNQQRGTVDKCDFCHKSRLGTGKKIPACVAACPNDALVFGELTSQGLDESNRLPNLLKNKEHSIRALRPELGTLPNVFYLI